MESFFLESPIWLGMTGGVIVAIAGYVWSQTGAKSALIATAGLLAVTILLVMVNIQIDTERESVTKLLHEIAAYVEANEYETVIGFIHEAAGDAVSRAKAELENIEFSDARVTRIKDITVNNSTSPPTAIAEFNAVAKLSSRGFSGTVPRFLKVYFRRVNDRWLIYDYEHDAPQAGFQRDE